MRSNNGVIRPLYKVTEYPNLRSFYQKMNADNQVQVVLKAGANAAAGASGNR